MAFYFSESRIAQIVEYQINQVWVMWIKEVTHKPELINYLIFGGSLQITVIEIEAGVTQQLIISIKRTISW